ERGRLGDRAAVPELGRLLGAREVATRAEAARLLARLPPDAQVAAALAPVARENSPEAARWAQVALTRLGDAAGRPQGGGRARAACEAPDDLELCARGALAAGDVEEEGRVLDRLSDELELDVQLTRALGASHDERALGPLVVHLGPVRARAETVAALGEL